MTPLSPDDVMAQVSQALPEVCRPNIIIIGSLAAGYHFFASDSERTIRTKDVDCMFSPHAKAVAAAENVTEQLLAAAWQLRKEGVWTEAGDEKTPDNKLPMIRLKPPGPRGGADWFIELLGAPDKNTAQAKTFHRVRTRMGHFAICSFSYLALAEWQPIETRHGLRIARPEMMALANMLHHPRIAPDRIAGTETKRSNKDLGRVLALSWLASEQDRRHGTDHFELWADRMAQALCDRFPDRAQQLALGAGAGIRELMVSDGDRDEALSQCNRGLLASLEVGRDAFAATGRRLIQQVIEPLEEAAKTW
jgi:hypothetical protein